MTAATPAIRFRPRPARNLWRSFAWIPDGRRSGGG
jgi:hypothetical protein